MKRYARHRRAAGAGRSLHRERGLKTPASDPHAIPGWSLPSQGAWIEKKRGGIDTNGYASLPSQGAWIENAIFVDVADASFRRSLHGERGLKTPNEYADPVSGRSLPSRGAWIENWCLQYHALLLLRRSLHGERGLKTAPGEEVRACPGRSLHGERGLKNHRVSPFLSLAMSFPSRGAWIEKTKSAVTEKLQRRRSLHGERGLKMPHWPKDHK